MQSSVNTDNLIDIRDVNVDKDLPKRERIDPQPLPLPLRQFHRDGAVL